jgi:hypothetical protein
VWNIWIIYPAMAWLFLLVVGGLIAYLRKPISESQIMRMTNCSYILCICRKRRMSSLPASSATQTAATTTADPTTNQVFTGPTS